MNNRDKLTSYYKIIRDQARAYMVATVVAGLIRIKYRALKPFRDLRDTLVGKLVQFYEKYQARKAAKEYQLFLGMKRAVEDCVVLYPEKKLKLEALKFFAIKELGTNLRWALKDYFKTHTDPKQYGEIMDQAFNKGASPPPDSFTHSGSVLSYDSATPPISVPRNIKNPDVQEKTKLNQRMWNYKRNSGGRTPREVAIRILTEKIEYAEKIISGEVKKLDTGTSMDIKEQMFIDKIVEHKARLEKLKNSDDWHVAVEDIHF